MKFQVKGLAKIKEAELEIKDLTVFVGKNSTNKSYMAHTVYMANKVLSQLDDKSYSRNRFITKKFNLYLSHEKAQKYIDKIRKLIPQEVIKQQHVEVDEGEFDIEEYREAIYDLQKINLNELMQGMYDFILEEMIKTINLGFNSNQKILENLKFNFSNKNVESLFQDNKIIIRNPDQESDHIWMLQKIFRRVSTSFFRQTTCKEQFYFPSSRTGFVLTFDEIVSGVLRDRFGGQPTATKLTEPTIDFISGFADIKSGKFGDNFLGSFFRENTEESEKKIKELIDFIEQRIVKGKILEESKGQNYTQFYLKPSGSQKLDLHLTSSATVELLPLVIFLKHFTKLKDRLLVIEEPEAHLHPKAQIEIARFIVMLVNAGAKVLVTTHSDYILNELSNCIKLFGTDNSEYLKENKLKENTTISKDRVSAYLFKDNPKNIEVRNLEIGKYGIANDNFDDVLDELLDRTEKINQLVE